jgi:hypothetical protein
MDAALHRERLDGADKRIHPVPGPLSDMPDGAVIVASESALTASAGYFHRWTEQGYGPPEMIDRADGLLTPPSTFAALRAGYRPILHPAIAAFHEAIQRDARAPLS